MTRNFAGSLAVFGVGLLTSRNGRAGLSHAHHTSRQSLVRVCAWCGRVKTEGETWQSERRHVTVSAAPSGTLISHGICPECRDRVV
jgi:hypothetical protein